MQKKKVVSFLSQNLCQRSASAHDNLLWYLSYGVCDILLPFLLERISLLRNESFDATTKILRIDYETAVMSAARELGFQISLCQFHKNQVNRLYGQGFIPEPI